MGAVRARTRGARADGETTQTREKDETERGKNPSVSHEEKKLTLPTLRILVDTRLLVGETRRGLRWWRWRRAPLKKYKSAVDKRMAAPFTA